MANAIGNWNYNEFVTFLLLHASNADLDFSDEEKDIVKSLLQEEDYTEISDTYDQLGDYETVETILSYKGKYFPTLAQKEELLGRMTQLFNADGEYSKLEKSLYAFLKKLL